MRVFVTGASGFVGRRLMARLRSTGHEARGADRELDVTDADGLRDAFGEFAPESVVHLAAMSSVAQSWRDPALCYRTNFVGTRSLLAAVEGACPTARVLLVGSGDQYAPTTHGDSPIDESTALEPRSPYARTKAAGELLGRAAARRGLDVVCARAFNHAGAGQSDVFVVSNFARQLARIQLGRQEPVLRVGNLASVRDFLHVDDVIRAYLALLEPDVPAGPYNIARGRSTTIQEVLDALLEIAGIDARVERDAERWRETDWLVGDASRLRDATGWAPEIPLERILAETYEDWLEREREA